MFKGGIYILLGTNMGEKFQNLELAIVLMEKRGCEIIKKSSVYKTEAWGNTNQDFFLNQVVEIESKETPRNLLTLLLSIEESMGRKRIKKWEPRIIDLDILFYKEMVLDFADLVVPHKHLHERNFTLLPLQEIAPNFIHPIFNREINFLLSSSKDDCKVIKL